MTPQALAELCIERINAFNSGKQFSDAPSIALVLPRDKPPSGRNVRLFGRHGPNGRIANCQKRDEAWVVVAYFNAAEVLKAIAQEVEIDLQKSQPVPK